MRRALLPALALIGFFAFGFATKTWLDAHQVAAGLIGMGWGVAIIFAFLLA